MDQVNFVEDSLQKFEKFKNLTWTILEYFVPNILVYIITLYPFVIYLYIAITYISNAIKILE